jgi:Ca-activated chloride channel family protein
MRFAHPDNLWLLMALPLLVLFAFWAVAAKRRALARFAAPQVAGRLTRSVSVVRQHWKYCIAVSGFAFLSLALGGPQFGAELTMAKRRGVDIVVALDVSRSMLAEDIGPNRLQRARYQIGELLDRLEGDRVGLVVFAGKAFVQCPLTLDYGALGLLLSVVDAGSIPVQGTAIGEAIELARGCFDEGDRQHKAIVLFTDGEDHVADPIAAADNAAAEGVRIFAIGMGTSDGELIPIRQDGGGVDFHRDRAGNPVKTRLDEGVLRQVAALSEGAYYRSSLRGAEIEEIYREIANMDQKEFESRRFTRYEERYQIPLALALACFALESLLGDRRQQRREWRGRFE